MKDVIITSSSPAARKTTTATGRWVSLLKRWRLNKKRQSQMMNHF